MSLVVFENYLKLAEGVVAEKADLAAAIDAIELESVLVSHGVVLLYAHMERCFQSALETKCSRCVDLEVRTFALSVKKEKTGRIGMDSVKGTLGKFGTRVSDGFKADLGASNLKDSWDSVMNLRRQVAHYGERASLSLAELRRYYEDIRKVLGLVCKALGLNAVEVTEISSLIILPTPTPAGALGQAGP